MIFVSIDLFPSSSCYINLFNYYSTSDDNIHKTFQVQFFIVAIRRITTYYGVKSTLLWLLGYRILNPYRRFEWSYLYIFRHHYCKRANIRGGFNFAMFAINDFSAKLKPPRSFYNTSVLSYLLLHVCSYIIRDMAIPAYLLFIFYFH